MRMIGMALCVIFMTALSLLLGSLFSKKHMEGPYRLIAMWCVGWTVIMASFYWPGVTAVLLKRSLTELAAVWGIILSVLTAMALAGLFRKIKNGYSLLEPVKAFFRGVTLPEIAAAAAAVSHAAVTLVMMHVDHDDYAYVANATTSLDTDTLLKYIGGTGRELTTYATEGMDRFVSSPLFALYAVYSKYFGTRPAALCHTYLPPVLTCLFFGAVLLVGYRLFESDRRKAGLFAAFFFLVAISSYYSFDTLGTFILVRSWQGKAQVLGLILPLIMWAYFSVIKTGDMDFRDTALVAVLLTAACLMSSMSALLAAGAAGAMALISALVMKNRRVFLFSLPALVLPLITAVIYLKAG